ncbi:MAG: ABC transporter ATP-binding protein, partial [Lachnospiraceae bacterium]|nr:ABC transporter ATP-binding protein [Lachnospiraceae bacterium]
MSGNKKAKSNSNKAVIKRILTHIKKYRFLVVLSFICAAISVAATLYAPILTGNAIDLIVEAGKVDFEGIKGIIKTFIIVIAVTAVSQWFMNIINNHITYHVVRDVRDEAFCHLQKLPLSYIDSHKHGDIVSRIVADIDQFADGLLMGFTQLFTGVVTIGGTLIFMMTINVPIALVVVVLTPVSLFVAAFIAKRTYRLFRSQSETRGEMTSLIDEMVGQQKIVQAFGYEDDALDRFQVINDRLEKDSMNATFYSSLTNPCTRFVNSLVYTAVGIIG